MGLTHHVPDGALLDFAGSLDSTQAPAPDHRLGDAGGLRAAGRARRDAAVLRVLAVLALVVEGDLTSCPGTSRRCCPRPRRRTGLGLALERRQHVAQPLHVLAGDLDGVDRVEVRPASIGFVPWLSKSQIGMSRIVFASGVPGLASILICRPSRCMWPATPRIVIGRLMLRVQVVVVDASTSVPQSRCSRLLVLPVAAEPLPRRRPRRRRGRTADRRRGPAGTASRPAPASGRCAAASGRVLPFIQRSWVLETSGAAPLSRL